MYIERELKRGRNAERTCTPLSEGTDKSRIDFIFLSPEIAVSDVYTIESDASDHLPLVADIGIKDI